nr:hypothetical protein [Bacteroides nordii]
MIVLQNYGVEVKGPLFDTMVAHYVLQPELRHGMDYLAEIYLHYQTIHIDELIGPKGKNQKNMRDLAHRKTIYRYACEDADVTLKLKNVLEKELKKLTVLSVYSMTLRCPWYPYWLISRRNGVLLDTEALKQSSAHFTAQMEAIEQEIYQLAGGSIQHRFTRSRSVRFCLTNLKIVEKAKEDEDRPVCYIGRGARKPAPQTSRSGKDSGTPRTEEVTGKHLHRRAAPA